ncbi:DUF2125 domain-containing protein [Rhizobium lentis]|uniref:DUF2125 domain-containing protein n=1 Tax=Rhizobium lentis TaxID=1138194 RepID=A0A9Q3QZC3_9HYPH|nr:DUF2125 domain-containing protein [Rhizobium lentis]MBX5014231.1 DUF2125 domain-containing protein [Rhizobium lentis]MBX5026809.1 DUF2125 domain-containing protein [Rhizobium lentis]MBX5044880.1 DUF2125 domain-containing protein [Rhizobium lentis]MBX5050930.1 DUF2125 domain-containing protein [Rhizobium lentis]MBX5056920.1 DUF2125 domain-containing protein [Rhizobium lentis]
MAASSRSGSSQTGSGKKFWLLGGGVLLVIALYTAAWFYAASALKTTVLKAIAPGNQAGVRGECADIEFRGYPFRIGLFCSKIDVDDNVNGVSATFGALRSAAQVYAPGHIMWELDSPAEIRTGNGFSISAQWANLQSSLATRLKGIDRSSTVIEGLKATAVSSLTGQTISFDAAHTEIHLRQNGTDLDGAISVQDANTAIKDWPQIFPKLSASIDLTVAGKAGLIDGSDPNGLNGSAGELRRIVADIGDGKVMTLTGPFSFDEQGFLSGKFKLEIERLGPWGDSLKQAFPDIASTVNTATKMLKALAGGSDKVSVDLIVDHGDATVSGFIPLGKIPPI